MGMTEREKLIELIQNAVDGCARHWAEIIADHLLSNGVIVPPVKLGSTHKIYVPIAGTTVVYATKVYAIGVDGDGDMMINPKEYPEEVISISGVNIGKTVFLTKEEAEKALKERSEGK